MDQTQREPDGMTEISDVDILVLPSYMGLTDFLKRFNLFGPRTVVATNNPAVHAFLSAAKIPCLEFPALGNDLSRKGLSQVKREIDRIAGQITGCRVYYAFYLSNVPALYFISQLSRRNELFFWNADPPYSRGRLIADLRSSSFRKVYFAKLIYVLVFKFRLDVYKVNFGYMLGRNFSSASRELDSFSLDWRRFNQNGISEAVGIDPVRVIYVDNISHHFPQDAVQTARILSRIEAHGCSVAVKPHPTIKLHSCFNKFRIIPHYIPMEVLYPFCKVVLGIQSNALRAEQTHAKVVSLQNCLSQDLSGRLANTEFWINKNTTTVPNSLGDFYNEMESILDVSIPPDNL